MNAERLAPVEHGESERTGAMADERSVDDQRRGRLDLTVRDGEDHDIETGAVEPAPERSVDVGENRGQCPLQGVTETAPADDRASARGLVIDRNLGTPSCS